MKKLENKYFKRSVLDELSKWMSRREILAIKGPRQSGKTTILNILKDKLLAGGVPRENIIFITLEDRDILEKLAQDAKGYVRSFMGTEHNETFYFFIDEFHYLKNGGQTLKLLYDIYENVKFIITGSSSLELVGSTAKHLVGRIFFFNLWQLDFREFVKVKSAQLSNALNEKNIKINNFIYGQSDLRLPEKDIFTNDLSGLFEEYAVWGGYPAVVGADSIEAKRVVLKGIYDTYISRDIIELLRITEYTKFKTLVSILSARIGNLINYNNLVQDAQSYFQEIKHYLSILEETYVIDLLRPYYTNRATEIKKNPKIYFIDIGLRNYINSSLNEQLVFRQDLGAIMENVIFSQIKFRENDMFEIKYWRTQGGAEVDFIIKTKRDIIPIEVKYSNFKEPKITRGFRNFVNTHKPARAIVLTKSFWGEMKIGKTVIKFVPMWYI